VAKIGGKAVPNIPSNYKIMDDNTPILPNLRYMQISKIDIINMDLFLMLQG